ncbi:MAG: TonB-dependent receptor domain-containing protein, partial [Bacteroidota bacterium]
MRHFFWIISLSILLASQAVSQRISVSGEVYAAEDANQALGFSSVVALNPSDSTQLAGTYTDSLGRFELSFNRPNTDEVLLVLRFLGYETAYERLELSERTSYDLGKLRMAQADLGTDEIEIAVKRSPIEMTERGFVVDPRANLAVSANSVLELLRAIPTLNVDPDGNITMRGGNAVTVLINGAQSNLTDKLDQISASLVENIEVITKPDARYDAAGQGGLVDIKLLTAPKTFQRWTGGVNVGVGDQFRGQVGGNVGYSRRKTQIGASGSLQHNPRFFYWDQERTLKTDPQQFVTYYDIMERNEFQGNASFNIDRQLKKGSFVHWETSASGERELRDGEITSTLDIPERAYRDSADRFQDYEGWEYSIDNAFRWRLNDPDSAFSMDMKLRHSYRFDETSGVISAQEYTFTDGTVEQEPDTRLQGQIQDRHNLVANLDFSLPLFDNKAKVLWGAKSISQWQSDSTTNQTDVNNDGDFEPVENADGLFNFRENIWSGYGQYEHEFGRFSVVAGLRMEHTRLRGEYQEDEEQVIDYTALFPNTNLAYKLNENHTVSASYNRRINRPYRWWLRPFVQIRDSLFISEGNPLLLPEFAHVVQLSHLWRNKKFDVVTTAFFQKSNNLFDMITLVEDGVALRRVYNFNGQL